MMNKKILQMLFAAGVFCGMVFVGISSARAEEITAIDFNGTVIGKVIPDGKVVGLRNQLIGNVTADSLIVDFDGNIIGGVVPQGIAIGNDNKPLGKVGNDGSIRLPSGKIVARALPNGLAIDEFYNVVGAVLFPGLVYADDGSIVGRFTGNGAYTNLQGQEIGFVSADGYAYRLVAGDYILEGRLISSKMVISNQGEFIGSLAPGGDVTNFDGVSVGHVKANGFVYDDENKIIGAIVQNRYCIDDKGNYLGFVTYNGEVVGKNKAVGKMRPDLLVVNSKGDVIGSTYAFAATANDFSGAYLGRVLPNGKVARAKEVMGYEAKSKVNDYWWWADALYMVMPVMTKMYKLTNDEMYIRKLYENILYSDSIMQDKETGLYFRDGKYVYPKHQTANGKKDFWARGDGWVLAGLAKVLQDLPVNHVRQPFFVSKYTTLARAVAKAQQPEGYWTRSMLDPEQAPGYETSGTAFFCYGLLWGVNRGYLQKKEFAPVIEKAWNYLTTIALQDDGKVGYVQPIGERAIPGQMVDANSQANFGVGAFLLAACEYVRYISR